MPEQPLILPVAPVERPGDRPPRRERPRPSAVPAAESSPTDRVDISEAAQRLAREAAADEQ